MVDFKGRAPTLTLVQTLKKIRVRVRGAGIFRELTLATRANLKKSNAISEATWIIALADV
jgi:hypothetical protein